MSEVDPLGNQPIEKLEKNLYARDFETRLSRSPFTSEKNSVQHGWDYEHKLDTVPPPQEKKPTFFKKLLIGSIIFFILCAGVAAYVFFYGTNVISADKVDISFVGPVTIAAGDRLSVDVVVNNNNNLTLIHPILYVTYPDGTKEAADITQDLSHEEDTLTDIPAGGSDRQTLSAILFGPQQATEDIHVKLEYGISASNATFTKEKDYNVVIGSSPLTMTVTNPTEVTSHQDIDFQVKVISNSSSAQSNLLLQAAYPFGFQFLDATPTPSFDSDSWSIPELNPGQEEDFTVHGLMVGEDGDERVVRFAVGTISSTSPKTIATAYLSESQSVTVRKSPLAVTLNLNSSNQTQTGTTWITPGIPIQGTVQIVNNLTTQVLNGQIQVTFSGNALDPASPAGAPGLYRQPQETITWDKSSLPQLASISPGQIVNTTFQFASLPQDVLDGITNGTVTVTATVTGSTVGTNTPNASLSSSDSATLKAQPSLVLSPRIVYSVGPFKNTGPVPPQAESQTSYTVVWAVAPSADDMSNVVVQGVLPGYVLWLGSVSPSNASLTWNSSQDEVVWHVGDLPSKGTPVQVAFKVGVVPSTSQVGTSPVVVSNLTISGTDNFTQNNLTIPVAPLTTNLSTDPKFQNQNGSVVQ